MPTILSTPKRALLLLIALLALTTSASAAVVQHFSLEDLTAKSTVVLQAKVTSESAAWNQGQTKIWTTYGLEIKESIKGAFVGAAQASARGGSVGRKAQAVSGEARLAKGSEYLLFLWKDKDNRYRMVGMAQGAFKVTTKNGVSNARNSYRGLTFVDAGGKAKAEKVTAIKDTLANLITKTKAFLPVVVADAKKKADKKSESKGAK